MNADTFGSVMEQVSKLLSAACYDSAEALCSLYLSSLNRVENRNSAILCAPALELLGDIIFAKGEYKRALAHYKQSSMQKTLSGGVNSRSRSNSIVSALDGQLRHKECQCHIALKDFTTAIRELEAIPVQMRDLKINMCMGKLYKAANLKRQAISSYTLVVHEMPSAVEAIEALVSLGMDSAELLSLLDDTCRDSKEASLYSDGWIQSLAASLIHKRNYDHDKCETKLQHLLAVYPKNLYLLTQIAKNSLHAESLESSLNYFKQARSVDPLAVDFMDQYGLLLVMVADETELNKLAHDLLGLSSEKPVGWLLVAMYCDFKRDAEKAMQFVEKAIAMDPKYAPGFRLKGQFLLSSGHPEQAVIAFFQATSLERDISSFTGLIHAYLLVGKFKDAIAAAKDAIAALPKSAAAYCLMGKVLSQVPEGAKEAVRAYGKALKLCPTSVTAATSMSEALIGLGRSEEAVICLRSMLNKKSSPGMRAVLAKALAAQGLHGDAIAELHLVLSMQPLDVAEVTKELERIESLMRGSANEDNGEDEGVSEADLDGGEEEKGSGFEEDRIDEEVDLNHSGGSPHPFELDEEGEENSETDADFEDREVGVLLDYDTEPEEAFDSPDGSFLGTAFATEERHRSEGRDESGSVGGSPQSSSIYRTRNHVRNLNLQTPF